MKTPIVSRLLKCLPLAVVLGLAACHDPEEFVLWSPDGRHAIVRGGAETAVVDAAGAIVARPFAGAAADSVQAEAWMPDSRSVLAVRTVKARSWSEFAPLLGAERAPAVIRAAEELLAMIRAYRGDWSRFGQDDPQFERWLSRLDFAAAYSVGRNRFAPDIEAALMPLLYLRERHPQDVAPLLAGDEIADAVPKICELLVRGVLPGEAPAELVLARSADPILWARPSPDGRCVALARLAPERPALYVTPLQGGVEPVLVDEGAAQAAWTLDGQALVYQKTTVPFSAVEKQAQLGTLTRRQVRDAAGTMLAKLPDPEDLAGVLFSNEQNRVACLPDGRILFAGCEVTLPATETARSITLFALRPGATPVIERVVAESARASLADRVDRFAVSPDGRHVALPGASGEVAILSLESGEVAVLQGPIANYNESSKYENSPSEPAPGWRSANELCYVVAPGDAAGSARRGEVVLRPLDGAPRALSRGWPDALTDGFLPRPKR